MKALNIDLHQTFTQTQFITAIIGFFEFDDRKILSLSFIHNVFYDI